LNAKKEYYSELLPLRINLWFNSQGENPRVMREISSPPTFGKEDQDSLYKLLLTFLGRSFLLFERA
jgi:hypothetical protein